jgi:multicomponent Na+:H+ antiporter subunit G
MAEMAEMAYTAQSTSMSASDWLVALGLLVGCFFLALSAIGMLRLPDVYSRMHAITKASTLGMAGLLGASAIHHGVQGNGFVGEILAMWFVLLTNPVGGHMIARSAYLVGIPMTERSVIDELDRAGEAADAAHDVE